MATDGTREFGQRGEEIACSYLKSKGFKWVTSNWRVKWGEIDLIMKDGRTLVFVEVKTRRDNPFGEPEEAVTRVKKMHLIKSALSYIQKTGQEDQRVRFDVVSIGPSGIRHFPDAVDGDDHYYY